VGTRKNCCISYNILLFTVLYIHVYVVKLMGHLPFMHNGSWVSFCMDQWVMWLIASSGRVAAQAVNQICIQLITNPTPNHYNAAVP